MLNYLPSCKRGKIPVWSINLLKLQLGIVYFFAGIAKLNYDWLIKAMPLKLWLPAHTSKPIIGFLFKNTAVAYVFSWFGALYDLLIPFLLLSKKTRSLAYVAVIVFSCADLLVISNWYVSAYNDWLYVDFLL